MNVTVRFAPSPTGRIHIGNARTALVNYLFALQQQGSFLLRFDDTDQDRSTAEFAVGIATDLAWLGIVPDKVMRQSERFSRYAEICEKLKKDKRLYACYESPDELERKRRRQLARGLPPVYDRAALALSRQDKDRLEAGGTKPHWRFLLEPGSIAWDDLVRGDQHIDMASLSDPVLVRADGSYLYTLPSVTDDIDTGITYVIRGDDHVTNTAVQIQLFEALGAAPPRFAHHNLLTGAGGEGLSKRLGSLSIQSLREQGLEPMAVASLAATIGTSDPVAPYQTMEALAQTFAFSKISRAPAKFDEAELAALNARLLHERAYGAVADGLAALGVGGGEAFWNAVRGNVARLGDALIWWEIVAGPIDPVIEEADYAGQAASLLPDAPFDAGTWSQWTGVLKAATGRKGRELFLPLRLALTGLEHGPEMAAMLPLIGREKALQRLRGARV